MIGKENLCNLSILSFDMDQFHPDCSYLEWNNVSGKIHQNSLSCLSVNARSYIGKYGELVSYLSALSEKFSFVTITETWLNEANDKSLEIDGYKSLSVYRTDRMGGGIKFYYLDFIDIKVIEEFTGMNQSSESLVVRARIPGIGNAVIGSFYRPPDKPVNLFIDYLTNILDETCQSKTILLGDFNINVNKNEPNINLYKETLQSYNFVNMINIDTYESPVADRQDSCLDHLWHNLDYDCSSFVLQPSFSDHCAIIGVFDVKVINKDIKIQFRDFSIRNINNLNENIFNEFSHCSPPTDDANQFATYLDQFLFGLLNKYFPFKNKSIGKKRLNSPWLTQDVLRCVDKKHRWFRLMKRGLIARESFKRYEKALRELLQMAEEDYHVQKLGSLSRNLKKNWRILNSLLGKRKSQIADHFIINNEPIYDPKSIADAFNNYFVSHPMELHNSIPDSTQDYSNLIPINLNSMALRYTTDQEVFELIKNIKKEGGKFDLTVRFLKICNAYVSPLFRQLFNICIDQSTYPDILKISKITPLHKKNAKTELKNYRPISVLCNLSKIFDSLLHSRIRCFFEEQGLLSGNQFGFRKDRSTELAACQLIDKITPAFQKGSYCICVFLDYSACFDTISRNILFSKLDKYGIRGLTLDFMKSYFQNRTQVVNYMDAKSKPMNQEIGIIQGSKNAPILFDIYSNDINFILTNEENVLYADDTGVVYVHDDLNFLTNLVNRKLDEVLEWCKFNKVLLNPLKSEYMVLTHKKVLVDPIIRIGNDTVKRTSTFKYLGVYIDEKLNFNSHKDYLKIKLSQFKGITFRLKRYLNLASAKKMYYACIYSIICYGITVWGGILQCTTKGRELEDLHSRIIKNLFQHHCKNSNESIFKSMEILKLVDIHKQRASFYMYKIVKENKCPTLQTNMELRQPEHGHDTRSRNKYILPFPRVINIKSNYKYQLPNIWNNLPDQLKNIERFSTFKKHLKTYFISKY